MNQDQKTLENRVLYLESAVASLLKIVTSYQKNFTLLERFSGIVEEAILCNTNNTTNLAKVVEQIAVLVDTTVCRVKLLENPPKQTQITKGFN